MDQSELLTILGGLYDKLVSDVAAKVQLQQQNLLQSSLNAVIDERVSFWAHAHLDGQIEDWVENNLDIDNKIEGWVENNLDIESQVEECVHSLSSDSFNDAVLDCIRNCVTFDIVVR